jgi:hypothetical protein
MTRADDEITLHILDRLCRKQRKIAVAQEIGMPVSTLKTRVIKVVTEDCAHDPEAAAYWKARRLLK